MKQEMDITALTARLDALEAELERVKKSNILWGKTWFATGDSLTEGDYTNAAGDDHIIADGMYAGKRKTYPYIIGERNGMNVINEARCGSILALSREYLDGEKEVQRGYRAPFALERYLKIPGNADYITLFFGANDAGHTHLGTIDDGTIETFYGAWNFILPYLIEHYPRAKIGVIVSNSGLTTPAYRQAIRDCSRKWGVPYLDLMGDYQIVPGKAGRETDMNLCEEAKERWGKRYKMECVEGKTNGHPSAAWHEFQSSYIEAFLRRL